MQIKENNVHNFHKKNILKKSIIEITLLICFFKYYKLYYAIFLISKAVPFGRNLPKFLSRMSETNYG